MSAQRDIHLDRGADWAATVDITDAGTPVDLSGYTVNFYLDGLTPSRVNGNVSVTTGRITLSLPHAVTATMSRGWGRWELWLSESDKLTRLYLGEVEVT